MIFLSLADKSRSEGGFRARSMAAVSLPFAAGILASDHVSAAACCAVAAAIVCGALLLRDSAQRAVVLIAAALFALGAVRYAQDGRVPPDDISRFTALTTAVEGAVASDPDVDRDRVRFIFRVRRARVNQRWRQVSGKLMVSVYTEPSSSSLHLHYGDRARLLAPIYRPRDPTNPNAFSWRGYLARQGIYACAYVTKQSQIRPLPGTSGSPFVRPALRARRFLSASIERIHPAEEASVIVGMVLGTYAYLPPDVFQSFSRTGTLHLLAASGYNCYIIVLLAGPLLRIARILPKRRGILMVCLILAYMLIAGAKPSLVRAAIVASLVLLALPLRRVSDVANLVFAAAFVMLMIDPSDLFDVGFQLSFMSVLALIAVVPIIESVIGRPAISRWRAARSGAGLVLIGRGAGAVSAAAVGTVAITLVTAPIIAYYFNYISLVSVPANMALALGVPLVFADGFLSPIGASVAPVGKLLGIAGTWQMNTMLNIVNGLGSLRYAVLPVAKPSIVVIAGYYLVLYGVLSYVRSSHAEG